MRQVLKIVPAGSQVLESFAGSSTTLLEAARAGMTGTWQLKSGGDTLLHSMRLCFANHSALYIWGSVLVDY